MTTSIPKQQWQKFFDGLSQDVGGWRTFVQVLSDDLGAQVLADGLPLNGITFEQKDSEAIIELSVGSSPESHQTHTVKAPVLVAFEGTEDGPGGVLDIEDRTGTKTLIRFTEPAASTVGANRAA